MTDAGTGRPLQAVLFACTMNRVRSPMAAALLQRRAGGRLFVDSCGVTAEPGEDPFVTAVLAERDIDLAHRTPKSFESVGASSFDVIVCLSAEAEALAETLVRTAAVQVEFWNIEDPTAVEGSRAQRLEAYRRVRDDLDRRVRDRFGEVFSATSTST